MLIEIPDHYVPNVGGAMVERAVQVINNLDMVPGYLFQFADLWDNGLHFGGSDYSFWQAVYDSGCSPTPLIKCGLNIKTKDRL